jgi:hypothetical protein
MTTASTATLQPVRPGMQRMLWVAALLVFSIGIPLFLLSELTERYFAWTIQSPLTAAFLGAAYWSSGVLELLAARERLWARVRSSVTPVLIFTVLTLIVTLVHLDRFHLAVPDLWTRFVTWAWLVVYVVVPVILGVLLVRQWRATGAEPARLAPLPAWMKAFGLLNLVLLLPLGLLMLALPDAVSPHWPWSLTPLTARAIGAWCVGLALLSGLDLRENDAVRVRPIRAGAVVFCLLQFVVLARYAGEPDWSRWTLWVYILFLIEFLLMGVLGLLAARRVAAAQP